MEALGITIVVSVLTIIGDVLDDRAEQRKRKKEIGKLVLIEKGWLVWMKIKKEHHLLKKMLAV